MDRIFTIVFEAPLISKKNSYSQTKSGRRFKPQSVVDAENLCLGQIPAEYVGLMLRHPAVEFFAEVPLKSFAMDVDGVFTTCLDILVKGMVCRDDRIRDFNGPKLIHPVKQSERKKFTILLHENGKIPASSFRLIS